MEEPCSLVSCLEKRYFDDDDSAVDDDIIIANYSTSPCKAASIGGLELIVLNHMNISHIGDLDRFSNLVKNVAEADLAWNNICKWSTVTDMLSQMPQLRSLNLSHNPLFLDESEEVGVPPMKSLRMLVLNGTNLRSSALRQLLAAMPSLVELHLSENSLACYHCDDENEETTPLSSTVRTLHLNRCGIEAWPQAARVLRLFPDRKTAFLYDNPIKEIRQWRSNELASLNCVNISKTLISEWSSIDELETLPGLIDLRVTAIPLLEGYTEEERFHLIVGRLEQLMSLNGSTITSSQRENAERFFIRYYQDSSDKPRQYSRLIEKHGELERLAKVDMTPICSLTVNVLCEENGYKGSKTIDINQTVGQLMKSLEAETGIRYPRMRMFYLNQYSSDPQECQYHNLSLKVMRIEEGDSFMVQSKLITSRRRRKCTSTSS